jgi:hypothetical protein
VGEGGGRGPILLPVAIPLIIKALAPDKEQNQQLLDFMKLYWRIEPNREPQVPSSMISESWRPMDSEIKQMCQ